jgi:hypothetical protein
MGKKHSIVYTCDAVRCGQVAENPENNYTPPDGWSAMNLTIYEEQIDCTCECHDEVQNDEGENVAGHEDWDCDDCPASDEYSEYEDLMFCPQCTNKIRPLVEKGKGFL